MSGTNLRVGTKPVRRVGIFDAGGRGRVLVYDGRGELVEVREKPAANLTSSTATTYWLRPDVPDYLTTGEQSNGQPIRYAKRLVQTITQGVQTRTLRSDNLGDYGIGRLHWVSN